MRMILISAATLLAFHVQTPAAYSQSLQPPETQRTNRNIESVLPNIHSVVARNDAGRPTRFRDGSGREYQCDYDDRDRPVMVGLLGGGQIGSRTLLAYDVAGRLRVARLASGSMLFIDYAVDGRAIARDESGNRVALSEASGSAPPTSIGAEAAVYSDGLRTTAASLLELVDSLRTRT